MRKNKTRLPALHPGQLPIAHAFQAHRYVVIRAGRRWGKTTLLERTAIKRACNGELIGWFSPQYKLNTPTYSRICRLARPNISRYSKLDNVIEFKGGGAIEFWTLDNPDAGRSRFYDLAIIDEASLVKKGLREIWEQAIAPTLLDRRGSAIMAGTPKGIDSENYFYMACTVKDESMTTKWEPFHAKTADNPVLDKQEIAELPDKWPALVYQQEYLAEFVDWSGAAFFDVNLLLVDGKPIGQLPKPDQIFIVIDTAMKDGAEHDGTACITFAVYKHGGAGKVRLVIVDYDILQIDAHLLIDWLPGKIREAREFAEFTGARYGFVGAWIEDASSGIVLLGEARRRGLPVEAIDTKIVSIGKEGRALATSSYVAGGMVKISQYAFDKAIRYREVTKNHLLDQLATFRIGMKRKEHNLDLVDCFTEGLSVALGDSDGW